MNRQIDKMIAKDIKSMDPIIKCKSKVTDDSRLKEDIEVWINSLCFWRAQEIAEVFNNRILNNEIIFIPLEGTIEWVGVYKESDSDDQKVMKDGFIESASLQSGW